MNILQRIGKWWKDRHTPLKELMRVECTEDGAKVIVDARMDPAWNQEFLWKDITRVCFKDEGISRSDIVFLEAQGREKPFMVLTEAGGGNEFMGKLVGSGLFPKEIFKKAVTSSNGGLYCWPPRGES